MESHGKDEERPIGPRTNLIREIGFTAALVLPSSPEECDCVGREKHNSLQVSTTSQKNIWRSLITLKHWWIWGGQRRKGRPAECQRLCKRKGKGHVSGTHSSNWNFNINHQQITERMGFKLLHRKQTGLSSTWEADKQDKNSSILLLLWWKTDPANVSLTSRHYILTQGNSVTISSLSYSRQLTHSQSVWQTQRLFLSTCKMWVQYSIYFIICNFFCFSLLLKRPTTLGSLWLCLHLVSSSSSFFLNQKWSYASAESEPETMSWKEATGSCSFGWQVSLTAIKIMWKIRQKKQTSNKRLVPRLWPCNSARVLDVFLSRKSGVFNIIYCREN